MTDAGRYFGRYDSRRMQFWADASAEQWPAGRDVFAYFNNDPEAMAVIYAQELRSLVRRN